MVFTEQPKIVWFPEWDICPKYSVSISSDKVHMYTCKFIGNWDQAHANVNPLFNMMLWKKENFKVKYYFYDQSYQFSEVLFLMCMLHFPKRSSGTPGDNNNNLF